MCRELSRRELARAAIPEAIAQRSVGALFSPRASFVFPRREPRAHPGSRDRLARTSGDVAAAATQAPRCGEVPARRDLPPQIVARIATALVSTAVDSARNQHAETDAAAVCLFSIALAAPPSDRARPVLQRCGWRACCSVPLGPCNEARRSRSPLSFSSYRPPPPRPVARAVTDEPCARGDRVRPTRRSFATSIAA